MYSQVFSAAHSIIAVFQILEEISSCCLLIFFDSNFPRKALLLTDKISLSCFIPTFYYDLVMRGGSRVNRQEGVKVVVRLRPQFSESRYSKWVYVSDEDENQLVVETEEGKKQNFKFDHIANQMTTQQELYPMIGQECVQQFIEGYNCCIFAYGQTGAGKTFSVLGNPAHLNEDAYCQTRGILPRALENIFQAVDSQQEADKSTVTCSYIQIYNEQVFDLLSSDKRIHQVRQDAKKGVFVQGLIEKRLSTYKQSIGILLEGEKTRKMASTLMNTESSRSHTIFTISVMCQTADQETIKSKKAKLHIVDLAGSQRVKHTNVEGERLREGCNINRSLHVLCNVINSLAESAKKKRHIPFRDSKLTHYLKDSLGGNSITKLLANIHTGRHYFGDTLSTLMFANRAKSLKMKVELNETVAENFDALRKEVRRLRQQLAQARYFKTEGRFSDRSTLQQQPQPIFDRIPTEQNDIDISPKSEVLRMLQQNQLHYKVLIEIYEEHMKTCLSSSNFQRKQNINIVTSWKNLEKRNISLTHLVKQLPSFAKIYKENVLLRQERLQKKESKHGELPTGTKYQFGQSEEQSKQLKNEVEAILEPELSSVNREIVQQIVDYYETLLNEVQQKFKQFLQQFQRNYGELQNDCRLKEKKIKDLKKSWQHPPDLESLKNQNEYLHLNILDLENQIKKLQESEQRMKLELKQSKKSTAKKIDSKQQLAEQEEGDQMQGFYQKLVEIKHEAEKQAAQFDVERAEMQMVIQKLQAEINKFMAENNRLKSKYSKSRSKKKSQRRLQEVQSVTHSNKKHLNDTPSQKDLFRSQIKYLTNSAVSMVSGNDGLNTQHQNLTKEILALKMDIKRKQKQIADLKKQLEQYINGDKKLEDEFGKSLDQIIEDYRKIGGKRTLMQSKSVKLIPKAEGQRNMGHDGKPMLKSREQQKIQEISSPKRLPHPPLK